MLTPDDIRLAEAAALESAASENTTMKPIVVIYHRADFDGLFCGAIARQVFGLSAEYIGWHYGDPIPKVDDAQCLYILDLSIPELMSHPKLIWIDHHSTAIEKYDENIPGFRLPAKGTPRRPVGTPQSVAACRLTWSWFYWAGDVKDRPTIDDFIARRVDEPIAVTLAGEYDVWDHHDPRSKTFQHGLRCQELTPEIWQSLLRVGRSGEEIIDMLLARGKYVEDAQNRQNESVINELGFTVKLHGLTFLACNHARYNSFLFTAGLKPEHDACLGFKYIAARDEWSISLYHAPGREHHVLSDIAKKYPGGGGHAGACGFSVKHLPWDNAANRLLKIRVGLIAIALKGCSGSKVEEVCHQTTGLAPEDYCEACTARAILDDDSANSKKVFHMEHHSHESSTS